MAKKTATERICDAMTVEMLCDLYQAELNNGDVDAFIERIAVKLKVDGQDFRAVYDLLKRTIEWIQADYDRQEHAFAFEVLDSLRAQSTMCNG